MKTSATLSTFDRIGVAVVALLGTCLGSERALEISTAHNVSFTPVLAVIFPGAVIGFAISTFVGLTVTVIVSGLANGVIYGFLMYGWNRLANRLSRLRQKS
jgi:hypothetical protein